MRHNKKRNTALLYEFLIRHVSKCLIESRKDEASKAVALLRKYYKSGPLRAELELFNCALNSRVKTPSYASKVLAEVFKQAKRIDAAALESRKNALVIEIGKTFGSTFYENKIPNYVLYASLQTLLNSETGRKKLHESVNRLQLEEKLVQHLLSPPAKKQTLAESMKLNPKYSNAVYRLVVSKFKAKYQNVLTESQYSVLTKYARSLVSENKVLLTNAVRSEVQKAKDQLTLINDSEIAKDKDLIRKIGECRQRLDAIDPENVSEVSLMKLLQIMALSNEVAK